MHLCVCIFVFACICVKVFWKDIKDKRDCLSEGELMMGKNGRGTDHCTLFNQENNFKCTHLSCSAT